MEAKEEKKKADARLEKADKALQDAIEAWRKGIAANVSGDELKMLCGEAAHCKQRFKSADEDHKSARRVWEAVCK